MKPSSASLRETSEEFETPLFGSCFQTENGKTPFRAQHVSIVRQRKNRRKLLKISERAYKPDMYHVSFLPLRVDLVLGDVTLVPPLTDGSGAECD